MRYSQAQLAIWNPLAYEPEYVKKAAVSVLARLDATREDADQATDLLANGLWTDKDGVLRHAEGWMEGG
jgi:hypothetical protein